jgi:F-type H+-transporting ATPase subunit c
MESLGAGLAIGIAACGGGIGIGVLVGCALLSIARQPEAMGKVRPLMFVGIAFVEACVLYALVITLILLGGSGSEKAPDASVTNPPAITETAAE